MLSSVESMDGGARVWVYPCERALSALQGETLRARLSPFLHTWTAHGHPLHAALFVSSYELALFVDERKSMPSGCSIDAWTKALSAATKAEEVHCFHYEQILLRHALGTDQRLLSCEEALQAWKQGKLPKDSQMANTQIKSKTDFFGEGRWILLSESWFARRYELP